MEQLETRRRRGIGAGIAIRCCCALFALTIAGPVLSHANAEEFSGPSFRKGMWHFVRTLELLGNTMHRQRVSEETTRCVDPTLAMKATFASAPIGECRSTRPEKTDNRYTFANRCDYMGPVRTVITVQSDEAYTEINEITVGAMPRTDSVIARRVGDCHDPAEF